MSGSGRRSGRSRSKAARGRSRVVPWMRTPASCITQRARLIVEVSQIAKAAGGQEVALHVFYAGLDDALLLRVRRRACIDLEGGSLRRTPRTRAARADPCTGAGNGALGVVDDDADRNAPEPLEGAPMAPEPGWHRLIEHKLQILMPGKSTASSRTPQVRRRVPFGSVRKGPAPKSTWAASPGEKLNRTVVSGGNAARIPATMRRTAE